MIPTAKPMTIGIRFRQLLFRGVVCSVVVLALGCAPIVREYLLSVSKQPGSLPTWCDLNFVFTNTHAYSSPKDFSIIVLILDGNGNTLGERYVSFNTTLPGKQNFQVKHLPLACEAIRVLAVTMNGDFVTPSRFTWPAGQTIPAPGTTKKQVCGSGLFSCEELDSLRETSSAPVTQEQRLAAIVSCKARVIVELGSAIFPNVPPDVKRKSKAVLVVASDVDSRDSLGAAWRTRWICEVNVEDAHNARVERVIFQR